MENEMDLLDKLKGALTDDHPESILDDLGLDYTEIETEGWSDEGKYQTNYSIFKIDGRYFGFCHSRSGSHYTDWYHQTDDVDELPRFEGSETLTVPITKLTEEMKNHVMDALNEAGITFTLTKEEGWK